MIIRTKTSFSLLVASALFFSGCEESYNNIKQNSTIDSSSVYNDNNFTTDDWNDYSHSKYVEPNFDEVFNNTKVKRLDIVISTTRWQSMLDDMSNLYGEFGTNSNNLNMPESKPTDGSTDMPLGPPPTKTNEIVTKNLLTETQDPIFVPADIYYNGKQWYKVGVRFKGNSSLQTSWQNGILKLSFKLDFDEFEDEYPQIDNQRFYGFKKLSLKNNYSDTSFLREKVASDIFRDANMPVSNTAFYQVYVDIGDGNGSKYFGLYTLVEEVDDTVIDTQFSNSDGNLYKPEDGSADFVANTFSSNDFTKKTNEDIADWSDIKALFTALHDTTRTTESSTWRVNLEKVFDVNHFLKYLALNGIIQNWDTYGRMTHNYFLYNNPENSKLTWIPWDNNEAFQDGKQGGALALDFSNLEVSK